MQLYPATGKISLKTALFFIVVLIAAFLPISSFLFYIKNDAFNNYFPPKFFMSESIRSGYLPMWNPYINFGIPQYGDMNAGFYSPITWIVASTVGYNAYTFTLEILLYIFLGGIGMYQLTGLWKLNNHVRIIAGIAFMCCGYNIGHLQHFNWLSGAAFLPWCLWSYLVLLDTFSLRAATRSALLFYLLIASAHPGLIIGAIYFFTAVSVFVFVANRYYQSGIKVRKSLITHMILLVVLLFLSAGITTGYVDVVPHFIRGEKISLAASLSHPTNFQSWISALIPLATVKNEGFFQTDPSMRNCYFSITLLLFLLWACVGKKDNWRWFLLIVGLLFALLSAGGWVKTFAYKFIPFIGYVRLNGEFRIFTLLCFIIAGAIQLDKFIQEKPGFKGKIAWVYYFVEIATAICIVFGLYQAFHTRESILFSPDMLSTPGMVQKLKALIDAISFYDTCWIEGFIQLLFLWFTKWCLKNSNWKLLQHVTVANIIIISLLNIPYTGTGKASLAQVQAVLNKSPKGIVVPALQPIANADTLPQYENELIGSWSMYSKQIGIREEFAYPIVLKNMRGYFEAIKQSPSAGYLQMPFLFTKPVNTNDAVRISKFSPNKIEVTVTTQSASTLVLQENFYPHWFYKTTDAKETVNKEGINFMSAPLQAGNNTVSFSFEPLLIKWMMLLSLFTFLVCCLILVILKPTPPSPS